MIRFFLFMHDPKIHVTAWISFYSELLLLYGSNSFGKFDTHWLIILQIVHAWSKNCSCMIRIFLFMHDPKIHVTAWIYFYSELLLMYGYTHRQIILQIVNAKSNSFLLMDVSRKLFQKILLMHGHFFFGWMMQKFHVSWMVGSLQVHSLKKIFVNT